VVLLKVQKFQRKILQLLRRDWRFFLWTSWFLILGVGIGISLSGHNPLITMITKASLQKLAKLKDWFIQAPLIGKIGLLWCNNVLASLFSILFGIFIFPPIVSLFENGVLLGFLQKMLWLHHGIAPVWYYLSLAPHGIFELPAFIIASGLGIRFGFIPWRIMYHDLAKHDAPPLFRQFFKDLPYYAILILLMLLVAAVLEVTVSPMIAKAVGLKTLGI
jgi:stage II sporulation protein M